MSDLIVRHRTATSPGRTYARAWDGIRPDARPADDLPTYRLPYEIRLVPKACTRCGSGLLDLDPGHGGTSPVRLVCVTCSSQLCWLQS